jgi:hypothetical protein
VRIPKKFELHLAAGPDQGSMQYDAIRIEDRGLVATDGVVAARVAIGVGGVRSEAGEELLEGAIIEPRAWAAAVQGTQGEGALRLSFGAQTATSGDRKPAMVFAPPEPPARSERPPVAEFLDLARRVPLSSRTARVMLDAEALHRLARALGAAGGVVLTFELDQAGRATDSPVLVSPADRSETEAWGAIMPIVREE